MVPFISVIIPVYNSRKTIARTIESLDRQTFKDFDVTIVDDKSTDDSVDIIKKLIQEKKRFRLIELPVNKGAANARNVGVENSRGDIVFFTDSDVILKDATVEKVSLFFKKTIQGDAIVGLPDKRSSFKNLASEHFNLRVHYNYINLPERINILYTSVCAVKRKVFAVVNGFNTKMKSEEDPELGFRLTESGFKIFLDKTLSVYHYKRISFFGLLKNDYKRSKSRVKLMFRKKMTEKVMLKNKGFISTPMAQIYSAMLVPFIWLSLILAVFSPFFLIVAGFLLFYFLRLYSGYLSFVSRNNGIIMAVSLYFLLIIDMTVVCFGILSGLINYLRGESY